MHAKVSRKFQPNRTAHGWEIPIYVRDRLQTTDYRHMNRRRAGKTIVRCDLPIATDKNLFLAFFPRILYNLFSSVFSLVVFTLFLSAATLVAANYGFTCPPRFMSVCLLAGRTKIGISQPCAVRLSWNLAETWGWYPRLACMFCFQDLIIFYIVNKQKNAKTAKIAKIMVLQNLRFLRRSKSDWSETWWGHPDKY